MSFKIDFLDHVAIRVKEMEVSIKWYEEVLGLKKYKLPEWGAFPVFMLSGKTGVAIFPANTDHPEIDVASKNVKIDHFAFNVSRENYDLAKKHFDQHGINYEIQDHHYFESIYLKDPDDHTVELTTIIVSETEFYRDGIV
ncbi:MAG: VOC family protein [bacterium]|nr:VOC family protein [bacterium]